jgi:hypothetical protein
MKNGFAMAPQKVESVEDLETPLQPQRVEMTVKK